MKNRTLLLFCMVITLTLAACGCTSPFQKEPAIIPNSTGPTGVPVGSGSYIFSDVLGNVDRPITVYTYRPAAWNQSGPVLIVMPGAGRDGAPSRNTWIPYAEKYSSLLIVPEFSLKYYPTDIWYNLGNTYDQTNWVPKENWTYTAVEHLFDNVRERSGATKDSYLLFGHSAGGQFVQRMVTLLPEARYSRVVAANTGVYLLPEYTDPYPFGLKDSPAFESNLPGVFSRKLIIMSGGNDTDPNAAGLANFPEAEAQGSTRFERAEFYFITARTEAGRLGVPLNWEYHIVPGVGHDEAGMAGPSAEMLFKNE